VVLETGEGVDSGWQGREVVINPALRWGGSAAVQGEGFAILGMPDDGTFAEAVAVPAAQLFPRPEHLAFDEAAALPLAGLTAYRALFRQGGLARGETVLVTGIGGGVAVLALQLAAAAGARVLVTSSSRGKIARALELGAAAGADYTEDGWAKRLRAEHGPVDLIIDGAGGAGYAALLDLAAPGGRVVSYGATAGSPERFDLFKLFWKQLRVVGSTMGSPEDFQGMLDLVCAHRIRPVVDGVFPLAEGNRAVESMERSPQFGKLVLRPGA
jgi:NADPH:quinone reductase-like Zn-dependent oxidoreductase